LEEDKQSYIAGDRQLSPKTKATLAALAIALAVVSLFTTRISGARKGSPPPGDNQNQTLASAEGYDIIIHNGRIFDGTGNPWYQADIGIRGDRIVAIGKLEGAHANKTIDGSNRVVAPGFIDMLGQSESSLLIDNRSLSKLSQGITSEITGEGGSIAPQGEKTLAPLKPYLDHYQLMIDWTTLDGYFQRFE